MTATIHLVRHAAHAMVDDVLVGRMNGVSLDRAGRDQAERLAAWLCKSAITAVQSSPRERAVQTAEAIARRAGRRLTTTASLDEVDFGDWTGRRFCDLAADPTWHDWNARRATARTPAGVGMAQVRDRIVAHLNLLRAGDGEKTFVLVSHAEIIRVAVLHCLGMSLNDFAQIVIGPASVTTIAADARGMRIVTVNEAVAA